MSRPLEDDDIGDVSISKSNTSTCTCTLEEGVSVEARFRDKGIPFYKGTISRVNPDVTFDISYEDGDRDTKLQLEHIQKAPGGKT